MNRRHALGLLATALPACAGSYLSRGEALKSSVRDFNLHVRWQKWQGAAAYVHPSFRNEWLTAHVSAAQYVRITDVQVMGVQPSEDGDTATVIVGVGWYRIPSTQIQQRAWQQEWRYEGREWVLVSERIPDPPATPPSDIPQWP